MGDDFETVHAVWIYYDQPVTGVADVARTPHFYKRLFDDVVDEYSDVYALLPLDQETFALVKEQWAIYLCWRNEFLKGRVTSSDYLILPEDRERYDQLYSVLAKRLTFRGRNWRNATATFRSHGKEELPRIYADFVVRWTNLDAPLLRSFRPPD